LNYDNFSINERRWVAVGDPDPPKSMPHWKQRGLQDGKT